MKNKIIILSACVISLLSCNKTAENTNEFAKIKYEGEYDFGIIKNTDTINHTFKIKNISNTKLAITKIGTSCGCTGAIISDSIVDKNEFAEIKVQFVPKKDETGDVKNSIVIEANTDPAYTVLHLKGKVN